MLGEYYRDRGKAILKLLGYSGMRLIECANSEANDFDWNEGKVVILGKRKKYRKALAGNSVVREWLSKHDTYEIKPGGIKKDTQIVKVAICTLSLAFSMGMAIDELKI